MVGMIAVHRSPEMGTPTWSSHRGHTTFLARWPNQDLCGHLGWLTFKRRSNTTERTPQPSSLGLGATCRALTHAAADMAKRGLWVALHLRRHPSSTTSVRGRKVRRMAGEGFSSCSNKGVPTGAAHTGMGMVHCSGPERSRGDQATGAGRCTYGAMTQPQAQAWFSSAIRWSQHTALRRPPPPAQSTCPRRPAGRGRA